MNSDFGTAPAREKRHRAQPKLRRALRRGVRLEYLRDNPDHMKWVWAAAERGCFENLHLPADPAEFQRAFVDGLASARVDEAMLVFAPNGGEERAVGLWAWTGMGRPIETHVEWFPWATDRNKLEGALKFLNEARKNRTALVFTRQDDYQFWHQLQLYGVIRWGTEIPGYFMDGSTANLFVSREQWGV